MLPGLIQQLVLQQQHHRSITTCSKDRFFICMHTSDHPCSDDQHANKSYHTEEPMQVDAYQLIYTHVYFSLIIVGGFALGRSLLGRLVTAPTPNQSSTAHPSLPCYHFPWRLVPAPEIKPRLSASNRVIGKQAAALTTKLCWFDYYNCVCVCVSNFWCLHAKTISLTDLFDGCVKIYGNAKLTTKHITAALFFMTSNHFQLFAHEELKWHKLCYIGHLISVHQHDTRASAEMRQSVQRNKQHVASLFDFNVIFSHV